MATTKAAGTAVVPKSEAISKGYNFASTWEQSSSKQLFSHFLMPLQRDLFLPICLRIILLDTTMVSPFQQSKMLWRMVGPLRLSWSTPISSTNGLWILRQP
nr:sec34-like family protein [Ipomoea batatas]